MIINILLPLLILGLLGLLFGVVLGFASKKFAVEVDPLIPQLRGELPGANCGGCGFTGCDAYAQAMAEGKAGPSCCPVGGAAVSEKLAGILGVESSSEAPKVAFVRCAGDQEKCGSRYDYAGIESCIEAAVLPGGGPKNCAFGCLGYGSCVDVCQFGAMRIENGVAKVDPDLCTACSACINTCPKHLITLVPKPQPVFVGCSNPGRGLDVKGVCSTGCIGCSLCVRNCPEKAIHMEGFLAVIDPDKCTGCGTCVTKCPVKAIKNRNELKPEEEQISAT